MENKENKYELIAIELKDWQSVGIANKENNVIEVHVNVGNRMPFEEAKKLGEKITKFLNNETTT
jgi:hypothetical protein